MMRDLKQLVIDYSKVKSRIEAVEIEINIFEKAFTNANTSEHEVMCMNQLKVLYTEKRELSDELDVLDRLMQDNGLGAELPLSTWRAKYKMGIA